MPDLDDRYTLAKRIPDMTRGCCIQTTYGEIELDPDEAQEVAKVVERLIRQRLEAQTHG